MSEDPDEKDPAVVLLAEDDEDDYQLTLHAFKEAGVANEVRWVRDGVELMDYLLKGLSPDGRQTCPRPALILLDLNMPRMNGREALAKIKSHPDLRQIPVVILTTSKAKSDILQTYDLGVNSFFQKPVRFQQFVDLIRIMSKYWLDAVKLPN